MKNVNNFQIAKVQPKGVLLYIASIFCQFEPGVAFKKSVYLITVYSDCILTQCKI